MLDKDKLHIEGGRIYLRVLTEKDATQQYCGWLNDKEVNEFLETKKATLESIRQYIKERRAAKECLFFGIFLMEGDRHIGNIKLEPIDYAKKKAVVGIMIGDKGAQGKGYGPEALRAIFKFCFSQLGMDEVELGVQATNTRAIKSYEKAGMKYVKTYKAKYAGGLEFDNVTMSIKKGDFDG